MKRFLLALGLVGAACTPPASQDAPAVQLYAMDCGRASFTDVGVFADDGSFNGQARELVDPCYLIRHPNGDLLWDTGFPEAVANMAEGLDLPQMGARVTMPVRLSDQLAQLSLTPADIEFVSISHSHGDHVGNVAMFPQATWIVDTDERAHMFRAEVRGASDFATIAPLENMRTQLIEGDGDYDVFGDGSVTIVQTPGHTPGHTILRVNLANAGTVLLTGDMWHLAESRERRTVPGFNVDRAQTLASMDKVEALAAQTNARVVRQHVLEDFEALPAFPEALN